MARVKVEWTPVKGASNAFWYGMEWMLDLGVFKAGGGEEWTLFKVLKVTIAGKVTRHLVRSLPDVRRDDVEGAKEGAKKIIDEYKKLRATKKWSEHLIPVHLKPGEEGVKGGVEVP